LRKLMVRMKYFFIPVIIFAVAVFGQSRVDTSNIGLVLKISLQKDTIWIGEPLIVTSTLINKSSKPIEIMPIDAHSITECGIAGFMLVEPSGERNFYHIGIHIDRVGPIAGFNNKKLLPSDSIYWRKLYWLENFGAPESLEGFAPGRYRIIGTYLYYMYFIDKHAIRNRLSDSISFILSYNPKLIKVIKPIREYLKNFFWWDGHFIDAVYKKGKRIVSGESLAECLYQYLLKIRRLKSSFILYADYLLPTIASLIKYRRKRALILADEFMKKYQGSPLSEEMAFCKGRLIECAFAKKPEQDSVMEVWLKPVFKQYPNNAYRFAFGDIWKKFE
jgi:hypothetical protein